MSTPKQESIEIESRYYTGTVTGTQAQIATVYVALKAEDHILVGDKVVAQAGAGIANWPVYREHGKAMAAELTEGAGKITKAVMDHAKAVFPTMRTTGSGDGFTHKVDREWTWVSLPAASAPESTPAGWFRSKKRSNDTVTTFFAKAAISEADAQAAFGVTA